MSSSSLQHDIYSTRSPYKRRLGFFGNVHFHLLLRSFFLSLVHGSLPVYSIESISITHPFVPVSDWPHRASRFYKVDFPFHRLLICIVVEDIDRRGNACTLLSRETPHGGLLYNVSRVHQSPLSFLNRSLSEFFRPFNLIPAESNEKAA